MYCGQCGKKVLENMLFCPFCGCPIVIPDQDVPADKAPQAALQDVQAEDSSRPQSLFEDYKQPEKEEIRREEERETEPFVPLSFDFDAGDDAQEDPPAGEEDAPQEAEVFVQPEFIDAPVPESNPQRPVRRPAPQTQRPQNAQKRAANTYIPIKELAPDDMFMDDLDEDEYDHDYDDDDYDRSDADHDRYIDDDFEYEEREHGGFFQRHVRGIVGLILLLIMMAICAIWAFSPNGQRSLAKINLAWTAQPYADLGYEAYMGDADLMAARYYEKAFSRDETNYEYAHSAMVAYYEADKIESAAAMLKKCIEMDPDNPEPYQEMLILYPDAQKRPWEISELIRLGYQRTGNESLKPG